MLEYFAYKKYKQRKDHQEEATTAQVSQDSAPATAPTELSVATATPLPPQDAAEQDAISPIDEAFLSSSLERATEPVTLRKRIASLAGALPSLPRLKRAKHAPVTPAGASADASAAEKQDSAATSEEDGEGMMADASQPDAQQTQIMKLLSAFNLSLTPAAKSQTPTSTQDKTQGKGKGKAKETDVKTFGEKLGDAFKVQAISDNTKVLLADFMQILKDIQSGGKLTGKDLMAFFDAHAKDLKAANDSVPGFVKTLVLKLLPISAIPKLEDLAKPGALMSLIKSVLQVLKTRFPAFVGGSVLMVLSVLIVLLAVWHAYVRGKEDRLAQEGAAAAGALAVPAASGSGSTEAAQESLPVRRELIIDGKPTGYFLDEDGMKIPVSKEE